MIRKCEGCTACCEGHLWGEAYGHQFSKGKPCHFMTKNGCSIYEKRPHDPCVTFQCAWILDNDKVLPEWMKPSESGVMIVKELWNDQETWKIYETNNTIDSKVLIWFMLHHSNTKIPISIQVSGGWFHFGPHEYIKYQQNR